MRHQGRIQEVINAHDLYFVVNNTSGEDTVINADAVECEVNETPGETPRSNQSTGCAL